MTERELRRLNRSALIELLIEQMEENKELEDKLKGMEEELNSRSIVMAEAGSIADASLKLNHVFDAADQAAAQYLENVQAAYERCESVLMAANQRATAIVRDAQMKAREIIEQAERESTMVHLVEEVTQPQTEEQKGRGWPWKRKKKEPQPEPAPAPEPQPEPAPAPEPQPEPAPAPEPQPQPEPVEDQEDDLFENAFREMMNNNRE